MIVVSEPQVWTLIGVFAGIMLGGFTLTTTLLSRTMRAGFEAVEAKFDAVDAKFDAVHARFATIDSKLDHLDRDVSALMKREFGIPD